MLNKSISRLTVLGGCILLLAGIITSCSPEDKTGETVFATFYGTKPVEKKGNFYVVEAYKTSAISDSTIGQVKYKMLLDSSEFTRLQEDAKKNGVSFELAQTLYYPYWTPCNQMQINRDFYRLGLVKNSQLEQMKSIGGPRGVGNGQLMSLWKANIITKLGEQTVLVPTNEIKQGDYVVLKGDKYANFEYASLIK